MRKLTIESIVNTVHIYIYKMIVVLFTVLLYFLFSLECSLLFITSFFFYFRSELQRLCSDFNLNYRDYKDYVKHDSQGRVPYSEIVRLIRDSNPYHNGVQSPSNVHSHDFSPIYPSYTNDSFTPEYPTEDEYLGHPRDPHVSFVQSVV